MSCDTNFSARCVSYLAGSLGDTEKQPFSDLANTLESMEELYVRGLSLSRGTRERENHHISYRTDFW